MVTEWQSCLHRPSFVVFPSFSVFRSPMIICIIIMKFHSSAIQIDIYIFFFHSVVSPPYTIFMGLNKHESKYRYNFHLKVEKPPNPALKTFSNFFFALNLDEDLIKWGFPEDVW